LTEPGAERSLQPDMVNHRRPRDAQSFDPAREREQLAELEGSLELLYGSGAVDYGMEELVVVCLLRNGRPYVGSFVEHYLSLGAKHLFFLDNGSTDGTVKALAERENVTVLRSELPFKHYQMVMKRYLMERFGSGRWVLCADIDELFDYPFSDVVDLGALLGYLNRSSYTAVVGQMLDMFPAEPVQDREISGDEPLMERHRFYDLSNVSTADYHSLPIASGSDNTLADEGVELLRDGIQSTVFGGRAPLTKHPLVFMDGETRPMDGSSHAVSGARIADLTCVIFHYKFLDSLYGQLRRAAAEENYMKNSSKHKRHLEILEQGSSFRVRQETSVELQSTNELVSKGFLNVSESYIELVEAEAGRRDPADTGKYQSLAPSLLGSQEAIRLRNRKIRELEKENLKLRRGTGKAEPEERREQELREQTESLRRQLQRVSSSRTWLALDALNRLKLKLLRRY